MRANGNRDREPVLHSALDLRRRALWLGELALYDDHLTIAGWTWRGAVRHRLPLDDIRRVEKRPTLPRTPNFVLRPDGRRDFYCQIPNGVFYWVKAFRDDERMDLEVRH